MYAIAFMSFFGYIFFVVFGGVGLTALPMDLITTFTNRPKIVNFITHISLALYQRRSGKEITHETKNE